MNENEIKIKDELLQIKKLKQKEYANFLKTQMKEKKKREKDEKDKDNLEDFKFLKGVFNSFTYSIENKNKGDDKEVEITQIYKNSQDDNQNQGLIGKISEVNSINMKNKIENVTEENQEKQGEYIKNDENYNNKSYNNDIIQQFYEEQQKLCGQYRKYLDNLIYEKDFAKNRLSNNLKELEDIVVYNKYNNIDINNKEDSNIYNLNIYSKSEKVNFDYMNDQSMMKKVKIDNKNEEKKEDKNESSDNNKIQVFLSHDEKLINKKDNEVEKIKEKERKSIRHDKQISKNTEKQKENKQNKIQSIEKLIKEKENTSKKQVNLYENQVDNKDNQINNNKKVNTNTNTNTKTNTNTQNKKIKNIYICSSKYDNLENFIFEAKSNSKERTNIKKVVNNVNHSNNEHVYENIRKKDIVNKALDYSFLINSNKPAYFVTESQIKSADIINDDIFKIAYNSKLIYKDRKKVDIKRFDSLNT